MAEEEGTPPHFIKPKGSVKIYTQKQSEIVEIIIGHLRSMDRACDDAEMKMQIDSALEWLERVRQSYKKKEEAKDARMS